MFSDSDIPSHKQNRASTGKLSVNTRFESHTPPTSHTESCSWCGPISFGSLSKGKHTLLITGGGRLEGGEFPRWEVKITFQSQIKRKQWIMFVFTSYNLIDSTFIKSSDACKSDFNLNTSSYPR